MFSVRLRQEGVSSVPHALLIFATLPLPSSEKSAPRLMLHRAELVTSLKVQVSLGVDS